MVAAYRARASEREGAWIADPWARALAGDGGFADALAYDRAHAHTELYIAVRTALLDDETKRAIADGLDQVVVLGAGYDTRAARLAAPGVSFFEVDHPSTQADKRARLATLAGYPVAAARYVSCDFENESFVERLAADGFAPDRPALFLWEGVVYYLPEPAVRETLQRIAEGAHPASRLAFDAVGKKLVTRQVKDPKDLDVLDRVAEMGEPLRFGVDDVVPLLFEAGFRHVRTIRFDEACLTYTGTYERDRKFRFQSLVQASVLAPPRP